MSSFFFVLIEFRQNQGKKKNKKWGNTYFLWGKKAFWVDCDKTGNRSCPGGLTFLPSLTLPSNLPYHPIIPIRFDLIRERETRLLDHLDSLQLLFINDRISSHSSKRKYRKENSHAPAQLFFTLLPSPPISKNRAPKKKPPTSSISSLSILTYSPFLSLSLLQFSSTS